MAEDKDRIFEENFTKAMNILASRGFDLKVKEEQKSSVKQLYTGGDLLAVLPTGFGKSLIFQLLTLLKEGCVIVVICPLKSIVNDQVKEAISMGISAASLSNCLIADIQLGNFQLVFASAEEALERKFLEALKKEGTALHNNLSAIVVDESHTVETWTGKRSRTKIAAAFRASFGQLSRLCSFCKTGTPVAALTGTADVKTQETIKKSLALKGGLLQVYVSPNRENLRFEIKKVKKEHQLGELQWLVDLVKLHGENTPKMLIFCSTLNEIAQVTNFLLNKLELHAYNNQIKSPENCFVGVYHSNSWEKNKERITTSLKAKSGGIKRVVVATTALCMGVNFPDIRYIICWGAARSVLDFHQEAGRAGRDGLLSHVIIVYHGQQIGPCETEMKEFLRSTGCLRVSAYASLDKSVQPLSPGHNCCTFCTGICKCGGAFCSREKFVFEEVEPAPEELLNKTREVSKQDQQDLKEALEEVVEQMKGLSIDDTSSHGFSQQLISDVVQNCSSIFTIEDVLNNFPVFSVGNALQILEIMQEIFLDIPNLEETVASFSSLSSFGRDSWFNVESCTFSDSNSSSEDDDYLSEEE